MCDRCSTFGAVFFLNLASIFAVTALRAAEPTSAEKLQALLAKHQFTGRVETTLTERLGRPLDPAKAELGRMLFFDKFLALHGDNSCAGCHSPLTAFGDSQSIAIGVENNDVVGPHRAGPRNQRRSPSVINNAFFKNLMWNGRFSSISGDPFDNSKGFQFPPPEGVTRFPAGDSDFRHLLQAQAHIPQTELPEMAGFTKISSTSVSLSRFQTQTTGAASLLKRRGSSTVQALFDPFAATTGKLFPARGRKPPGDPAPIDFDQFDVPAHGFAGVPLPPPIAVQRPGWPISFDESRNEPIRDVVVGRLSANETYFDAFLNAFPELGENEPITSAMVGQAIAEFEFTLTFTNAPIDRFARGETSAMTPQQQRGGVLFFSKARCIECHAVSGQSNEMFSDFEMHVAGIPQIAPRFGKDTGNVPFRNRRGQLAMDGNQDFGLFDITEDAEDMYKFRTSPLRNVALQATFFHNGAFTRLSDALRYHLNAIDGAKKYNPVEAGVAPDLVGNTGPIEPVLRRLDPRLATPILLSEREFADLLAFIRDALLDDRARPESLRSLIPAKLPSHIPPHTFEEQPPN